MKLYCGKVCQQYKGHNTLILCIQHKDTWNHSVITFLCTPPVSMIRSVQQKLCPNQDYEIIVRVQKEWVLRILNCHSLCIYSYFCFFILVVTSCLHCSLLQQHYEQDSGRHIGCHYVEERIIAWCFVLSRALNKILQSSFVTEFVFSNIVNIVDNISDTILIFLERVGINNNKQHSIVP